MRLRPPHSRAAPGRSRATAVVWPTLALVLGAPALHAQSAPPLRGVVYDSLARGALADAVVRVAGTARMTTTDAKGHFRLDSVATGTVALSVEHPRLDSIGLYELAVRVPHDGKREHKLAIPGLATVSRAICGRTLRADSAIVYGSVRTPESAPARHAEVVISWLGVSRTGDGKLAQRRLSYITAADSLGRFVACGLPADEPYTVAARGGGGDSLATLHLELPARSTPVLLQELMLSAPIAPRVVVRDSAAATPGDLVLQPPSRPAGPTGVVRGQAIGPAGEPIANALVALMDVAEVRTDSAGRFLLPDVPTGSRRIGALAVGRDPASQLIMVKARDTVTVTFTMARVTTLGAVETRATVLDTYLRGYEERKRTGLGRFMDSTALGRLPSVVASLSGFPGVVARTGRGGVPIVMLPKPPGSCLARLFLDGRPESWEHVNNMIPSDIAFMEVYARDAYVPPEFQSALRGACGVVAITSKWKVAR